MLNGSDHKLFLSASIGEKKNADNSVWMVPVCEHVCSNVSYLTAGHDGSRVGVLVKKSLFSTFPSPDGKGLREEGAEERF